MSQSQWGLFDWGSPAGEVGSVPYTDNKSIYVIHESGAVPGTVATITYSNLKNSHYTDTNGVKHNISKIVRTFSNLSGTNSKKWADLNKGRNPSTFNNANPMLVIYGDPNDGFWYNWSDGVTITDQFFDENGRLIDLSNNAYISISSLNNSYDHRFSKDLNNTHIEGVAAVSGGKAYALAGSSVKLHNGVLYSPTNNSDIKDGSLNDGRWDSKKSADQYYGSGIIKLNNNDFSIRFETTRNSSDVTPMVWAYYATVIPETPTPRSIVRYHYDVLTVYSNY